MTTDREGEFSEGWPWPMMTKAVESVIESMDIEARLQQNEQAIADIEAVIDPELPATLNRIEHDLRGQDSRIDSIEAINIEQALADIEAGVIPELPATLNRIEGNLDNQNDRLNYLEAIDFVEMINLQKSIQSVFTNIGKFYYDKVYLDKYYVRNNTLDVRLLSYVRTDDLGSYLDLKLNRAEFDEVLAGQMTQETTDRIAFSLADVDVYGVRKNLGDYLEELTLKKLGYTTTYPGEYLGTLPIAHLTERSWMDVIDENREMLDNLPEVPDIPDIPDVGGMVACFTGENAMLRNLTYSLDNDIGVLSTRLDDLKTRMATIRDYYEDLRVKLQAIRDKITGPSISKETMQEIIDAFTFFISNMKGFFSSMSSSMDDASQKMGMLSQKASDLKDCGSANLDW